MPGPIAIDLTDYELSVLGKVIVSQREFDLSMFTLADRREILAHSALYLKRLLDDGKKSAVDEDSYRNLEMNLTFSAHHILKPLVEAGPEYFQFVLGAADSFTVPWPRLIVMRELENNTEAQRISSSFRGIPLEEILATQAKIAGREPTAEEFAETSRGYLLRSNFPEKLFQIERAGTERRLDFRLRGDSEIIVAALDDADQIFENVLLGRKSKGYQPADPRALNELISRFLGANMQGYISLAQECLSRGKNYAAAHLSRLYLANAQYPAHRDGLEILANNFLKAGMGRAGKEIFDQIQISFDYRRAFDYFVRQATDRRDDYLITEANPESTAALLLEVEGTILTELAQHSAQIVISSHDENMKTMSYFSGLLSLYTFARDANKKADNLEAAQKVGIYIEELLTKMATKFPIAAILTVQRNDTQLGEALLQHPDYFDAAWAAYHEEGVIGIKKLTDKWALRFAKDEIANDYYSHPVEILSRLFLSRKMNLYRQSGDVEPLNPEALWARKVLAEYALTTGDLRHPLAKQCFEEWRDGNLEIGDPHRFAFAMSLTGNLGNNHFSVRDMLRNSEVMARKMPEFIVPESLYRDAAVEHLGESARFPLRTKSPKENVDVALGIYQSIGHIGLARFIEANYQNLF